MTSSAGVHHRPHPKCLEMPWGATGLQLWLITVCAILGSDISMQLPWQILGVSGCLDCMLRSGVACWLMQHDRIMEVFMLQMAEGKWFDREGKRVIITQYHEVIGDLLGRPAQITVQVMVPGAAVLHAGRQPAPVVVHSRRLSIAPAAVQIIIIISLVGTNSAQIVASASDAYYLDSSRSKRWAYPLSQLCSCRHILSAGLFLWL